MTNSEVRRWYLAEVAKIQGSELKSSMRLPDALQTAVEWNATSDPLSPWKANVQSADWRLRLNDFPDEALYTLLVNGTEIGDLDDWPAASKPKKSLASKLLKPVKGRAAKERQSIR